MKLKNEKLSPANEHVGYFENRFYQIVEMEFPSLPKLQNTALYQYSILLTAPNHAVELCVESRLCKSQTT
ncbi:hypothetical protein I7I53_01369 [Histoplasma capsulatum var. duboisii H88]|uniref:Uncharacterized protein n=1 Tax=Ajellomyces capsulatus (strain H88) TaxID=544711 RepID=A0A8A1LIV2_AJEC8|nr:hypothetical protein I7I53_01369 [Histoplasma capsulatum var. duboisii H88]